MVTIFFCNSDLIFLLLLFPYRPLFQKHAPPLFAFLFFPFYNLLDEVIDCRCYVTSVLHQHQSCWYYYFTSTTLCRTTAKKLDMDEKKKNVATEIVFACLCFFIIGHCFRKTLHHCLPFFSSPSMILYSCFYEGL